MKIYFSSLFKQWIQSIHKIKNTGLEQQDLTIGQPETVGGITEDPLVRTHRQTNRHFNTMAPSSNLS